MNEERNVGRRKTEREAGREDRKKGKGEGKREGGTTREKKEGIVNLFKSIASSILTVTFPEDVQSAFSPLFETEDGVIYTALPRKLSAGLQADLVSTSISVGHLKIIFQV